MTLLADGTMIGTGKADEGVARFALTSAVPSGGWMIAHQSAPAWRPDRMSDAAPTSSRVGGAELPPPVLQPPIAGATRGPVTGVYDGADVTIERRSGS